MQLLVRHPSVGPLAPLSRSPVLPLSSQVCFPALLHRRAPLASRGGSALPLTPRFPPTTAPLQTLHLDVWGPSTVLGPLLEPWLLARGGAHGLRGLRLHSDRCGDFSSTRLEVFCHGQGITQSYTLPDSPQQNEPSDAWPQVTQVFLWTGSRGVAADYRVWGSLAYVRAPVANNLSVRTPACVFLGFPLATSNYAFYDPVTCQFFSSQDVTFDESVCYYKSCPHRGSRAFSPLLFLAPEPHPVSSLASPPSRPALSRVSHVTPHSSPPQFPVPVVSRGAGGAAAEGEGINAVGAYGANSGGAGGLGVGATPVEDTAVLSRRTRPASPPGFPSVPHFPPRSCLQLVVVETEGVSARGTGGLQGVGGGGSGSGGAGAGGTGTLAPTPRTVRFMTRAQRLLRLEREEQERLRGHISSRSGRNSSSRSSSSSSSNRCSCSHRRREWRGATPATAGSVIAAAAEGRGGPTVAVAGDVVPAAGESRGGATAISAAADVASPTTGAAGAVVQCHRYRADHPFHLTLRPRVLPRSSLPSPPESSLPVPPDPLGFVVAAVPHLCAMLLAHEGYADAFNIPTPHTHMKAVAGPYAPYWIAAEEVEIATYRSPPVFKARYMARVFNQREGVEFFQTFAPTRKITTLRALLHVAAQRDYELHSLDFSTTFLQGSLHEQISLRRPPGFTGSFPAGTQWQLHRPIYGLRQAPREWHDMHRTTLAALDSFPSSADPSLFVCCTSTPFFVLVYVDDLVFATPDRTGLASVKEEPQRRHTCTDLGELQRYLDLQITRDRAARTIMLT
ncbi:unnamed protein product [Closterium sp. NIES-54]